MANQSLGECLGFSSSSNFTVRSPTAAKASNIAVSLTLCECCDTYRRIMHRMRVKRVSFVARLTVQKLYKLAL
eukprot:135218-Pyramimonas_sp.AAC.2